MLSDAGEQEKQPDILDEAEGLLRAARRECCGITPAEALQVMAVQRLDQRIKATPHNDFCFPLYGVSSTAETGDFYHTIDKKQALY